MSPGAPRLSPLEPPVSPTPAGAVPPAPLLRAAEPMLAATSAPRVSLEAQLLRFRLVTTGQMSEAMRIEAESGTLVSQTVVERSWVSAGDLQKVIESLEPAGTAAPEAAAASAPAPVAPLHEPVAEPARELRPAVAEPGPASVPQPPVPEEAAPAAPAPAAPPRAVPAGVVRVIVRLRSGELLEAAVFENAVEARRRAKELVDEVQAEDTWPFIAGRLVSVEKIDTIYLEKH